MSKKPKKEADISKQANIESEECFVIMPISDPEGYEKGHFKRVYEDIIKPSVVMAGFKPLRADDVVNANYIQLDILRRLIESPMAVCDLSTANPNVMFELGIRQAFDKPVVLIQEAGTRQIFDISGLRYDSYNNNLKYHEVVLFQEKLKDIIISTKINSSDEENVNSLIKLLALSKPAQLPVINDSDHSMKLDILVSEVASLKASMNKDQREPHSSDISKEDAFVYSRNLSRSLTNDYYANSENLRLKEFKRKFLLGDGVCSDEDLAPLTGAQKHAYSKLIQKYKDILMLEDVLKDPRKSFFNIKISAIDLHEELPESKVKEHVHLLIRDISSRC